LSRTAPGGWRSGHGNVLSGIASWGFVVASVDFTEYGFASFASPSRDMTARRTASATALDAALDLLGRTTADAQSPLAGLIDMSTIAAVGHSRRRHDVRRDRQSPHRHRDRLGDRAPQDPARRQNRP